MSLSDISIRNPVFAWMLMLGLIFFGAVSYTRLGVSQLPDVDFPVLNVSVQWPGAAPDVIEAEIVDALEQAVVSVEGITDLNSTIRQGSANISLEFDIKRNIDAALQEVQAAISRVRLPLEVEPPTIRKQNPEDQPILWMAVGSDTMSLRELITFVELKVKDQFQIIPGVGEVLLGGYTDRNLRVWINNEKLSQYELTITDIRDTLERGHIETAAGTIENTLQELNLRFMGEGLSVADVGNLIISSRGGRPIYNSEIRLKDVVRIEDGLADIRRLSRIDGKQALGIGIRKQRGANAVQVGKDVRKKINELTDSLKSDLKIGVVFDTTTFVKEAVEESQFTLLLSAIITAFVCFLFLGSLRPTLNILLSIPTSIVGSFTVIYFLGFTLNLFTILALALAIGIVVDDAIMVLENIYRHKGLQKNRQQAAIDGANEITFAAVAASFAVIAIFLPVAFMQGVIGKFFFQFGITISVAVFLSLIEAVTLTPMRCAQMLDEHYSENKLVIYLNKVFEKLAHIYRRLLTLAVKFKYLVLIFATILFIASLGIYNLLRKEFIPPQDQSTFLARIETPVGSSMSYTSDAIKKFEDYISKRDDVLHNFVSVGGFGGGEVNSATAFISLKTPKERKLSQMQIMQEIRQFFIGDKTMKVVLQDLSTRGLTARRGFPVDLNIRGAEWETLHKASEQIVQQLDATGLVIESDTDYRLGQPEIKIWPKREEAGKQGVTIQNISSTIEAAMGGIRQGKFTNDGRRYDVRIKLTSEERLKPQDILNLTVRNVYGELVPMRSVVDIKEEKTLQTITRKNRERSISIYANIAPGKSQSEALKTAEQIAKKNLPATYKVYLGGGAQTFVESFSSLTFVLLMGIVVAYMILASQFNSFIHPIIVFLSMPFSLTGAFLALYLFDQSINLYSMIGIILLMGIVKKNAILLVEFTNHKSEVEGLGVEQAILEASPIRLRPILMTSLATLAAALPPALALGPGAETRIPMAVTIIGGVLVSTFFTIFVTPCAYAILARENRAKIKQ